ncbi:WhiB family transcriptional regulator [Streptomyces albipurpureus]|uniref:WhiB family transcriptional regulator n=1 Tax=Streptomyces albipurpureus TaxID=2897419 RepID=A0ABT0V2M8_9ACTN|nr:WhiB family transcriptional regulator [Streptomyces sp. CWNU-1]MCM2394449.1 WhiB family transcriptional regulator [Streptomyces sp. CWNU-1]
MIRVDWARAACRYEDPDLWYGEGNSFEVRRAIGICRVCPIRVECLATVLQEEQGRGESSRFGVQGGLTPRQRYRRARASAKARADA